MKPIYQKHFIITQQKIELFSSTPLAFYVYNNITNHDLQLVNRGYLSFFNSSFLLQKAFYPLSRGSYFISPLFYNTPLNKLFPISVVLNGYVLPYSYFEFCYESNIKQLRSGLHTPLFNVLISPVFYNISTFYRFFFFVLLQYANYKSITEKVS